MRRLRKLLIFSGVLAPTLFLGLKWGYTDRIKYPVPACERHVLTFAGQPVVGVEDMAYDDVIGRIYMSAYDRKNTSPGGIYSVDPDDLSDVRKLDLPGVNYPHGIDFSRNGNISSLAIINRSFEDTKQSSAQLQRYQWSENDPRPAPTNIPVSEGFCNANNLTQLENMGTLSYLVTRDHQSCRHSSKSWENLTRPDSSDLVSFNFEISFKINEVKSDLYFANGITTLPDNQTDAPAVYVAETRKKRISVFEQTEPDLFELIKEIPLPGGPDNLTRIAGADVPGIWAAMHPDLIKFAAFRAGRLPAAQSRFAQINPNEAIEVYDVPSDIISGATVALDVDGQIFLGAAYDDAIAICDTGDISGDT